jgi:hypothetical protein
VPISRFRFGPTFAELCSSGWKAPWTASERVDSSRPAQARYRDSPPPCSRCQGVEGAQQAMLREPLQAPSTNVPLSLAVRPITVPAAEDQPSQVRFAGVPVLPLWSIKVITVPATTVPTGLGATQFVHWRRDPRVGSAGCRESNRRRCRHGRRRRGRRCRNPR